MRPISLTISGVNSFIEKQAVDFEAAGADNLFCVSGCTGSGKTTILDCIILALYSKQNERGSTLSDYINLKCDEALIEFTFELSGTVYQTVRRISRKQGKNLMLLRSAGGEILAEGDNAFRFLSEKIGLDVDEFTNVVVLQQGRFSRFLKATKGERVKTIGRLFELGRFSELYTKFNAKAGELSARIAANESIISRYADITDELFAAKGDELKALAATLVETERARVEAKNAAAAIKKGFEDYCTFSALTSRLNELEAKLSVTREAIEKGREYKKGLEERERTLLERERARDALIERRSLLNGLGEQYRRLEENEGELNGNARALELELKRIDEARSEVGRLATETSRLETELDAAFKNKYLAAAKVDRDVKKCDEELLRWTAREGERLSRVDVVRQATAELEKRKKRLAVVTEQAVTTHKILIAAEGEADTIRKKCDEARRVYDELVKSDALAVIAGSLKPGDVCPVCGERINELLPVAVNASDVTEETLKGLEARRDELERRLAASTAAHGSAQSDFLNAKKEVAEAEETLERAKRREQELAEAEIKGTLEALKKLKDLLETDVQLCAKREKATETLKILEETHTKNAKSNEARKALLMKERRELDAKAGADYGAELKTVEETLAAMTEERAKIDELKGKSDARLNELNALLLAAEGEKKAVGLQLKPCPEVTGEQAQKAELADQTAQKKHAENIAAVEKARGELTAVENELKLKKELSALVGELKHERDKHEKMAKLFSRGAFSEFVAGEYVKAFTRSASSILGELTGGKYSLHYDEKSGDFAVADFLSGNERRSVKTLSGGETFLASLALAIAISEELSRNRDYGFFFIDEGFGTLSEDALDTVMSALERLSRDTLVGVITHRSELIERIPSVIKVERADEEHGSRVLL